MLWHLEYLEDEGVATEAAFDEAPDAWWWPRTTAWPTCSGQATEAGLDVDDVQVVAVLETERDYLEAIGAIGPRVADPTGTRLTVNHRRNRPVERRLALSWSHRGKEVVQLSSHCSHGTSEVAGR